MRPLAIALAVLHSPARARLQPGNPWPMFQFSVALQGGTALVGVAEIFGAPVQAAVYVFERDEQVAAGRCSAPRSCRRST